MSLAGTSWEPVDLREYFAADLEPDAPTICRREDGVCLLYPGRTHTLAGEPESGKSWLALLATVQLLRERQRVFYIDFEDDARRIAGRLRAMGATEQDRQHLTYMRPDQPVKELQPSLCSLVRELGPDLVVVDGVTEAMSVEGLSIINNDDAAIFQALLPRPLAALGPAVLLLDHVTKNKQARGRNALGAGHKLAAVSGAAYLIERGEPFGKGRDGNSLVVVAKDRPGAVRQYAQQLREEMVIGTLLVSSGEDGRVGVRLVSAGPGRAQRSNLEKKKQEICSAMGTGTYVTKTDIKKLITGNNQTVTNAINELIEEGKISRDPYRLLTERPRILPTALSSVPPEGG